MIEELVVAGLEGQRVTITEGHVMSVRAMAEDAEVAVAVDGGVVNLTFPNLPGWVPKAGDVINGSYEIAIGGSVGTWVLDGGQVAR